MSVSLDVAAFASVADVLVEAVKRPASTSAIAFIALGGTQQLNAVETAAIGIKALNFAPDYATRDRAEWRLKQANIEEAIRIAKYFDASGPTDDPLSMDTVGNGNVKEETLGPITTIYFGASGSLDAFASTSQRLLKPLLDDYVVPAAARVSYGYGQGSTRRVS